MTKWTRVLLGAGFLAAAAVACDDSSDGGSNNKGTGGSATGGDTNTGGTTNNTGGTGGSTSSGGQTNSGGSALGGGGMGGEAGTSVECADGCVVLSAPLTAKNQSARWQISLASTDASTETLTFRVYVKAGTGGGFQYGFQNGESNGWQGIYPWKNLSEIDGWQDITIDLKDFAPADGMGGAGGMGGAPAATGPDSSKVQIINLWVESGGSDDNGPWTNPTLVYVDSVKSSNGTINYEFSASAADLHLSGNDNVAGASATFTTIDP